MCTCSIEDYSIKHEFKHIYSQGHVSLRPPSWCSMKIRLQILPIVVVGTISGQATILILMVMGPTSLQRISSSWRQVWLAIPLLIDLLTSQFYVTPLTVSIVARCIET
jgi:hypothetical protein